MSDDGNKKLETLRKEVKTDFKTFVKNNSNSGLIQTMEEVRSFAADLGDRLENIEDTLEELNKVEDLPNISRHSS